MSNTLDKPGSSEKMPYTDDGPPEMSVSLPSMEDVETRTEDPSNAPLPVDIVLLTVNDCEFLACYRQLTNPFRCWFDDIGYVYFEGVGEDADEKVKVALIRCCEGSSGPGGALIAVKNSMNVLRPKAVISVGACSSLNPQKAKLGDVVVSAKLTTYGCKVVTQNQEQWAGMRSYVSKRFLNIIKHTAEGYKAPLQSSQSREIKIHSDGEFLRGPEHVRAEWRRDQLAKSHPHAIALEMEGEGVFTAAFDDQIEWLIVKGIADYADGAESTTESWSPFASVMAASVVAHILRDPNVFRTWPHYQSEGASSDCRGSTETERGRKRKRTDQHPDACLSSSHTQGPITAKSGRSSSTTQSPQWIEGRTMIEDDAGGLQITNFIQRIRQFYQRREAQVLPVPWNEDFSFHLKDLFTRLRIVEKEKTRGMLEDEITNMTGIFRRHKDCQKPRIVLIEGEPGMGKTTYCQKLAYDWATKKENEWDESFPKIEVLLLLRCRDIKSSIWEAIDEQILPRDFDEEAKVFFLQFLRENQSKVLLVLDGLDEVDPSKLEMYLELIQSKELPECHIILTSRHEAGKRVRKYCDTLWEIVGFGKEDAKIFIRKYFQHKEHLAEKLINKLWPSIHRRSYRYYLDVDVDDDDDDNDDDDDDDDNDDNDNDDVVLRTLTKNPLHTTLLCVLFEDFKGDLPKNRTQLFIEIVLCVLHRYEKKNGLSSDSGDLLTVYKKDLKLLGHMALESLRNGELHFEKKERVFQGSPLIKFGFLSIQTGGSKRIPCIRCGFLHKSLQEFFSGLYLAFQILDGEIDSAYVVTDERYQDELFEVFRFMGGIVASSSEEAAVSLVSSWVEHVNYKSSTFSADLRGDLRSVFFCVSEWTVHEENFRAQLVDITGKHLDLSFFTELDLSSVCLDSATGAESLSQALKVNSSLTNTGAKFLSQALKVNSSLTYLDLSSNHIGHTGAESLSQALTVNSSLTNLKLSNNSFGNPGAESLSQALKVNPSLTNLDLSSNHIGHTGAESLCQALTVNSSLTNLKLNNNSFGNPGAESLSQALKVNSFLTNLDLSSNHIGHTGAECLSQALTVNSSLTNLNLRENSISDTGAESLSQALKVNSSLTKLNLSANSIGGTGAESLSQALTVNSSLTKLKLNNNSIGDTGAESLSQALKVNSFLTNLDLSFDRIGDTGVESLSQALTVNSSLTKLKLKNNSIGVTGAESLSQALKVNSFLTNLELGINSIGDTGAESLSQALTVNSSLTKLKLKNNSIGVTGAESLSQALKVNSSLTNLDLNFNRLGDTGVESLSQARTVNSSLTKLKLKNNRIGDTGAESLF